MLIGALKNAVTKTASEKIALNAQKARALANSVGLIPHYKSDWKWALRQMRKHNPDGLVTSDLMKSGKELADAKHKIIGLLSNNDFNKIIAKSRRHGSNSKEVAMVGGDLYGGDRHSVRVPGLMYGNSPTHHTHPGSDIVQLLDEFSGHLKSDKPLPGEIARMFDPVLMASPSGWIDELPALKDFVNKTNKARAVAGHMFRSMPESKIQKRKLIRKARELVSKELYGEYSPKNSIPMRDTTLIDILSGNKNISEDIGDIGTIINAEKYNPTNIISRHTTGVHKFRPKHDSLLRSVYFDKGLNT